MRHIEKKKKCQDFENYIIENNLNKYLDNYINNDSINLHPWTKFTNNIEGRETKRKLAKHFYFEQKGLCVYCQQSLQIAYYNDFKSNISHIEHLKPKKRNRYPEDTFNQNNLTLSCNGFDCTEETGLYEFCGHNKKAKYNGRLFLNPIEIKNTEKYFEYTINGEIIPNNILNETEKQKAEYMIYILDLNYPNLIDMRKEQYNAFIDNEELNIFFNEDEDFLPSFFSMLKQFKQQ